MTPGLEALRIVADLKCILLRLPVQTTESRGFKMKESEVFFVFFFSAEDVTFNLIFSYI